MSRYLWKLGNDLGGNDSKDEIKRYDSFESFNCCLISESISSVVFVPDSVINACRPGKLEQLKKQVDQIRAGDNLKEDLRSGFIFVAGTTEGTIHVFSSFSLPVKVV